MTDEPDDLAPVVSLAEFRERRSAAQRPPNMVHAAIVEDQLQLSFTRPTKLVALELETVEWLRNWCAHYLMRMRALERADEHRCRRCSLVVGIECRGHPTKRMHYRVEVVRMAKTWVSTAGVPGAPELREYVAEAKTSCGRVDRHTDADWSKVTCYACLKRKPKVVP